MKTAAVVPLKRLDEAKGRLAGVLTPHERALLARKMLDHVLNAILSSTLIDIVAVITPDDTLPLPPDVTLLPQKGSGLNRILEQGRRWSIEQNADALLIIFADLPLLTPRDLDALVKAADKPNTIVLAPDRHGGGTNALLAHPPSLAHFNFGPHSYRRHLQAAARVDARSIAYTSPGTTLDIDTPDDLQKLSELTTRD
jgi:2-phospho-L-lactate guanylyltransferase